LIPDLRTKAEQRHRVDDAPSHPAHRVDVRRYGAVSTKARRQPNLRKVKATLLERVPGGERKWRLIERLGPMEAMRGVFVQRVGLDEPETRELLAATTITASLPKRSSAPPSR